MDHAGVCRAIFEKGFNEGDFSAVVYIADDVVDHCTFAAPSPGRRGMIMRIQGLLLSPPG